VASAKKTEYIALACHYLFFNALACSGVCGSSFALGFNRSSAQSKAAHGAQGFNQSAQKQLALYLKFLLFFATPQKSAFGVGITCAAGRHYLAIRAHVS
jgi:hypothetical protein